MFRRFSSGMIFSFAVLSFMFMPLPDVTDKEGLASIPFVYSAQAEGKGPSGGEFIRLFDKDHDNKISRMEFSRSADEFDQLDTDSNGYIEAEEIPKGPPAGGSSGKGGPGGKKGPPGGNMPGINFIRKYDRTGDDKVSKREYPRPSREFKGLDKNDDGFIDIIEAPFIPPEGGLPRFRGKGKGK